MDYLKKFQINIKPPDQNFIELFGYINSLNDFNILNKRILEIGLGTGNKSIGLSRLFTSYYGIEPDQSLYQIFLNLCEENDCKIKSFNMSFDSFVVSTDKKFKLIIMENVIHFLDFDNLIKQLKKISYQDISYVLIKNPKARPYGWGNLEFCIESEKFNKEKFNKFRDKLKVIYNKLDNSKYLIKKISSDFSHYFLLQI